MAAAPCGFTSHLSVWPCDVSLLSITHNRGPNKNGWIIFLLKSEGMALISTRVCWGFYCCSYKEGPGVPPGNIQADPHFVPRVIGQAFVSLEKQFPHVARVYYCVPGRVTLLFHFFCQATEECMETMSFRYPENTLNTK